MNSKITFKPAEFLFKDWHMSWVWLLVRLHVGWLWFDAGLAKVKSSAWVGDNAGAAVTGFLNGALAKTVGEHPDVQAWYAWLINHIALPNAELISYLVSFGELLVGIALVLGALTAVAAFFGLVMNFNYLFAGAISTNPKLIILQLFLLLAWRTAGWFGLDRWLLPKVVALGKRYRLFATH